MLFWNQPGDGSSPSIFGLSKVNNFSTEKNIYTQNIKRKPHANVANVQVHKGNEM